MSKRGGGSPNSDNDGQGGKRIKNLTFYRTSCEQPLNEVKNNPDNISNLIATLLVF